MPDEDSSHTLSCSSVPKAFNVEAPHRRANTVSSVLHAGERPHNVYYHSTDAELRSHPEAFIAAGLLPAMARGGAMHVGAPVSQQFLEGLETVQDIYTSWWPELKRVRIDGASATQRSPSPESQVASFFSGGVDSFYTLLKHREEIDTLIFVHGFDVALEDADLRNRVSQRLREAADAFGKRLIEVETNLRTLTDSHRPASGWERAHGAALASVALLLAPEFRRVYVPATHTYRDLFPWGSHPLLDTCWSTEALALFHDGCEATRVQKCEWITDSDAALQSLRVCWRNPGGSYNCGECEKCQRTMINLLAAGGHRRCPTFDRSLSWDRVASMSPKDDNTRAFLRENLAYLEQSGKHPEGVQALRKALDGLGPVRRAAGALRSSSNSFLRWAESWVH